MKCVVFGENFPKSIVEVLAMKLIAPDGETEKLIDPIGIIFSLEGSDLVGNND